MKYIDWLDDAGYSRHSLVRDGRDDPRQGIPFDPPALDALGLPPEQQVAVHNALAARGLLTWRDVVTQQDGITSALRTLAARGVLPAADIKRIKRDLVQLYRQEGNTNG